MQRSHHLHLRGEQMDRRRLKILLVDDNESDASLVEQTFAALRLHHDLQIIKDSEQALAFLNDSEAADLPDLMLVDLHMPKRDGIEVLSAIRGNPKLRPIPVIVWTSSQDADDAHHAYECGANAFLQKPERDFADLIGDLDRFWFRRAELPRRTGSG
jgi:chemotaxis family two-component system response regulator Rcp1